MAASVAKFNKPIATKATQSPPRSLPELQRHGLTLYKELLKYTRVHPNPIKKQKYLKQIRADFRRYAPIKDERKLEDMIKKGTSRLSYIRMEIPGQLIPLKYRMDNIRDYEALERQNKTTTTLSVDSDGKLAAGISTLISKARFVNWCDGNNDPDEKRKNDSLVERYHYRGPYWEKRRKGWLPQEAMDLWQGPGITEALMHREKYDIGFDLPTPKLEDHPDVKEHFPNKFVATRKDFGLDNEPDVCEVRVKQRKEVDYEDINKGMHIQYNDDQRDKTLGKPTVTDFLRGRREK